MALPASAQTRNLTLSKINAIYEYFKSEDPDMWSVSTKDLARRWTDHEWGSDYEDLLTQIRKQRTREEEEQYKQYIYKEIAKISSPARADKETEPEREPMDESSDCNPALAEMINGL